MSASYGHGAAVFELSRSGDKFDATTIWENERMKNKFTSSVLHNGHIYGLDESILASVNADTYVRAVRQACEYAALAARGVLEDRHAVRLDTDRSHAFARVELARPLDVRSGGARERVRP